MWFDKMCQNKYWFININWIGQYVKHLECALWGPPIVREIRLSKKTCVEDWTQSCCCDELAEKALSGTSITYRIADA